MYADKKSVNIKKSILNMENIYLVIFLAVVLMLIEVSFSVFEIFVFIFET